MARSQGYVLIRSEECKGCGLCIHACPPHCLDLELHLSAYGVHPARYAGAGCTACGICFYVCPAPGAITVYRTVARAPNPSESVDVFQTLVM